MKRIILACVLLAVAFSFAGCEEDEPILYIDPSCTIAFGVLAESISDPIFAKCEYDGGVWRITVEDLVDFTDEELRNFATSITIGHFYCFNDPNEAVIRNEIFKRLLPERYWKNK